MPLFLDFHRCSELSVADIKSFLLGAQRGAVDEHGVRPIELYCGDDGHVFCVHEAGTGAAIRRRHRSLGLPCGEVHELTGMSAGRARGDEKAALQLAIAVRNAEIDDDGAPNASWAQR